MVFENMTYDVILAEMLDSVKSDVDKRQGSVIYDALAPAALKLAEAYAQFDGYLDLVFADTAVGEYLDRKAGEFGVTRKAAIYAQRRVETDKEIPIGSRWGIEGLVYAVTERMSENVYNAVCSTAGDIGNAYSGRLDNIDNVSGVTAELKGIYVPGVDEETDEALRERMYQKIQSPAASGNADDYVSWATSVSGVGAAKVLSLWNGNGTVKVLVVDDGMKADETLEGAVTKYIEAVRPIGATVTVDSPEIKEITVTAGVILSENSVAASVEAAFKAALEKYLKGLVFKDYTVSYAKIGSILLGTEGIYDYTGLTVNGGTANISLGETEIPVMGAVALREA